MKYSNNIHKSVVIHESPSDGTVKAARCHCFYLLLETTSDATAAFWQSLFLVLPGETGVESQMAVKGQVMNHPYFQAEQSSAPSMVASVPLALRLVIKLKFQTFKLSSYCLKKLQFTSPKQLSRTWLLGSRPLTICQFLPKQRKIVNIHILRKLLVFQLLTFLPQQGFQFISGHFILYLVFINNSEAV